MALLFSTRQLAIAAILALILVSFVTLHRFDSAEAVKGFFGKDESLEPSPTTPVSITLAPTPLSTPTGTPTKGWEFQVDRDGDNYGLTDEQCESAFPKLFVEIEKSIAARKDNPITFEEFDSRPVTDGMVRALVYNGELYLINFENMSNTFSRGLASLHSLNRALTAAPNRRDLPNIEFEFTTEDSGDGSQPLWAYSKKEEEHWAWLMPDFGYWSWPEVKAGSYRKVRHQIAAVDDGAIVDGKSHPGIGFYEKNRRLLWRGNVATSPEIRGDFMEATKGKKWADVKALDWGSKEDIEANLLPMGDHCRYMFLAHTEGRSFSGRGKYLQNCRSVFVAHKLQWKELHHGALESSGPNANYVEVERDFSDLEAKIEYLVAHPDEAKRIADNSVRTFRDRYLTPAAEPCYWRRLIKAYASVCDFEPRFYNDTEGRKWRGVPFESFVLTGTLEWETG
ncbi:MAG: hypothetical protein M1830_009177 [Pleopsidium flavum]|nr:MAG: hypothetical protein M1830_009177 [Pleopsidium flavum]